MSHWLLALTAVLCMNLAVAQDDGRLDAPACRQALAALQAQEARALAASVTVPRTLEPPRSVTGCDAVGCWAGDGSYLLRSGPNLVSPRGLCSLQGTTLVCP